MIIKLFLKKIFRHVSNQDFKNKISDFLNSNTCFCSRLYGRLFFYPIEVEPEVTKPQNSQTTNLLTESLKNAQKKKKSIFDDSDDSESDSENDVYQDTTNDSTKGQLISEANSKVFI